MNGTKQPVQTGDSEGGDGWEAGWRLTGRWQRLADIPHRAKIVACGSQISKPMDGALMTARVTTPLRQSHFGSLTYKGGKALNPETSQS